MADFDRFANGAKTFLTSPLTSSGTSVYVSSVAGFPVPPFKTVVNTEILKVTAVDSTGLFFTVDRGQENTTQTIHYVGSQIVNVLTRDSLLNLSVDNNIANFALSSSQSNPYASELSNTFYLIPKNGDRISLIDPVENLWRIFYIKMPTPNHLGVSQNNIDLNKLVDVFAYYDHLNDEVQLYQSPPWSIDNPQERIGMIITNGILTRSDNIKYRYLDTYQIKKPSTNQIASFGWKTLNLSTNGNIALYHNNFNKIMIKTTSINTIYSIEKGYDGQRIVLLNDSQANPIFLATLSVVIPEGFASVAAPNNQILQIDFNAGIELYYDACFEKWNIIENKTTS